MWIMRCKILIIYDGSVLLRRAMVYLNALTEAVL